MKIYVLSLPGHKLNKIKVIWHLELEKIFQQFQKGDSKLSISLQCPSCYLLVSLYLYFK